MVVSLVPSVTGPGPAAAKLARARGGLVSARTSSAVVRCVDGRRRKPHPRARARVPSRRIAEPDRRPVCHRRHLHAGDPVVHGGVHGRDRQRLDVNAGWANLLLALGGAVVLFGGFGLLNLVRGRRFLSIPQRLGVPELVAFVTLPALLPVVFSQQFLFGFTTILVNVVIVVLAYVVVGYG